MPDEKVTERREPHVCTEEKNILEVAFSVKRVEENVALICKSNAELIKEFKKMTTELAKHMADNREHRIKIKHLEGETDILFKKVDGLTDWQNKMKGIHMLLPVGCTVISTLTAVAIAIFHFAKGG